MKILTPKETGWRSSRLNDIRKWEEECPWADFIDEELIYKQLEENSDADKRQLLDIIEKAKTNALSGDLLSVSDVAALLNCDDPEIWDAVFQAAEHIKKNVYGNRVVLFAPLYVSSLCVNNCAYCGFRNSNPAVNKRRLVGDALRKEVEVVVEEGQKRLILVYGEHPDSDVDYICETIKTVYDTKKGFGEIRRANINAAPLFVDEYEKVKKQGIGTYQIFQETYHHDTYKRIHPENTLKGRYKWRLFSLHRAFHAGIDDVAIGVLFGLYDWKFEVLGLLLHAMSLEKEFGIGPHTISYPRLRLALNSPLTEGSKYLVSDEDFKKLVAIIRLMCPYTGSILTAREEPEIRMEMIDKGGVSQMDAGSRIAVGGYSGSKDKDTMDLQQFMLKDNRSLDEFIYSLCKNGHLPSFCTAGYREGRTGANFMPLAKSATVKNFCISNGLLTFKEYLMDHASEKTRKIGEQKILPKFLGWVEKNVPELSSKVKEKLIQEENNERDKHF